MTAHESSTPEPLVVLALHDRTGHYWTYAATAITSLMVHTYANVRLVILHDATLTTAAQERLRHIAHKLGARELRFRLTSLPEDLRGLTFGAFTPASLYRLLIPAMFPQESLVIYLDADLVFNGVDVAQVAEAVPCHAPLSGVVDPYIHLAPGHVEQQRRLSLAEHPYVNSGVLAFRPKLITHDLLKEFVAFGQRFGAVSHPDQDFLNHHFGGTIGLLPAEFNLQACPYERSLLQPLGHYEGKVVHYAGKLKPLDGMLAPGFLPFWRYTFLLPELSQHPGQQNAPRYLFPLAGDRHGLRRVVPREQPPAPG